jgi:hypothetical protein
LPKHHPENNKIKKGAYSANHKKRTPLKTARERGLYPANLHPERLWIKRPELHLITVDKSEGVSYPQLRTCYQVLGSPLFHNFQDILTT